jgi:membrane protein YdbS with pleckstrin-like domain
MVDLIGGKKKLHSKTRWLFRLGGFYGFTIIAFLFLIVIIPIALPFILVPILTEGASFSPWDFFSLKWILLFLFGLIVTSEIYARLAYNNWFYEFGKDNFKFEHGIIWKKQGNVPYGRIQNVDIHRGIIARLFGFSTVVIQTAGYSSPGSEGGIPGVSLKEAEKIREFLIKRISKKSSKSLSGI